MSDGALQVKRLTFDIALEVIIGFQTSWLNEERVVRLQGLFTTWLNGLFSRAINLPGSGEEKTPLVVEASGPMCGCKIVSLCAFSHVGDSVSATVAHVNI